MNKLTLLVDANDTASFSHPHIRPVIGEYFDVEQFDPNKTYNPAQHIAVVSYMQENTATWYLPLEEFGHKVVIDHLWDGDVDCPSRIINNRLVLRNSNWMWYNAHYEYLHYGSDRYQPGPDWQHPFLLLMNLPRWHRDLIIERLADVLPESLYSYKHQNKFIDNDIFDGGLKPWRAHFHPEWYDTTAFSVVAESYMRTSDWVMNPENYKTEVSEKVFKPIIFYHPFIVYGSADTLKYLHAQGFETFPEIFDEHYDAILDDRDRFDAVTEQVFRAVKKYNLGELTVDAAKLQRNHDHFFDQTLVRAKFVSEVVRDILHYVQ
jgi:hypothetical protein